MESFILPFVQRILSGAQNGLGYSKKITGLWILAVILVLFTWTVSKRHELFITYFIVNVFVILLKTVSFDRARLKFFDKIKDIHFWEVLATGGFVVWMVLAGYNIIMICCSVHPALIIHKGLINLGSGLKFFDSRTDDPTGKTYGIPLLGIKIRRSSTAFRVVMAIGSLILAGLTYYMKWDIHLSLLTFPAVPFVEPRFTTTLLTHVPWFFGL